MIEKLFSLFSRKERFFLLFAILVGFGIAFDYAIVRPVSNSLFLHAYGSSWMPYAWVAALPLNLFAVFLYNRFLPKIGCLRLFCISAGIIALGNSLMGCFIQEVSFFPFIFYIWKEMYILLMLQQLWSVIHATIAAKEAKYIYGVLFGFGAFGGFCGSLIPGFQAVNMGSENLLFFTLPIYAAVCVGYYYLIQYSGSPTQKIQEKKTSAFSSLPQGIKLISSSKLLLAILAMTAFMQITATLTDFQFHSFLEKAYPEKDVRTEFFGKVVSLGNTLTMSLQFFGTFLLIRFLGMHRSHLIVPSLLAVSAVSFLLVPSFFSAACCFLLIKSFDFSLFGVVKELLYVPMRLEEKFQAKAIIDVLVYRSSKVLASCSIVALQFFCPAYLIPMLSWINVIIFIMWCFLVLSLRSEYGEAKKIDAF